MSDFARWLAQNPPPNLQDLVDRAGRRHAASIGEVYVEDPFKRPPHQAGYQHISAQEWAEYDLATVEWQERRRAHLKNQIANNFDRIRRDVAATTAGARPWQTMKKD
jgi:hypothetical protein